MKRVGVVLLGPVLAAACLIDSELFTHSDALDKTNGVNDSKKLSAQKRESVYADLLALRELGLLDLAVAEASVAEIEELNILGATRLAMQRAMEQIQSGGDGWGLPAVRPAGLYFVLDLPQLSSWSTDGLCVPFPMSMRHWLRGMPSRWLLRRLVLQQG